MRQGGERERECEPSDEDWAWPVLGARGLWEERPPGAQTRFLVHK